MKQGNRQLCERTESDVRNLLAENLKNRYSLSKQKRSGTLVFPCGSDSERYT